MKTIIKQQSFNTKTNYAFNKKNNISRAFIKQRTFKYMSQSFILNRTTTTSISLEWAFSDASPYSLVFRGIW